MLFYVLFISVFLQTIQSQVIEKVLRVLAKPVAFIKPETVLSVSCHVYGNLAGPVQLFEDNSYSYDYTQGTYNWLRLTWNGKKGKAEQKGKYSGKIYTITDWKVAAN
jgi:alpha-D-xyloside xylohydrolase